VGSIFFSYICGMGKWGILKVDEDNRDKCKPNAGVCMDCEWDGWLSDTITEYEWD